MKITYGGLARMGGILPSISAGHGMPCPYEEKPQEVWRVRAEIPEEVWYAHGMLYPVRRCT